MRRLLTVALVTLVGWALVGCPTERADDDDTAVGGDDTTASTDDDTTGEQPDDDTSDWPGSYRIVRICGSAGGDPASPGPDIDAVQVRRDTSPVGYASLVTGAQVPTTGNDHPDTEAALGEEDGAYVSVGGEGSFLDLTFDLGEFGDELIPGDLISLFELDDGSGELEHYEVLVSDDGSPDSWVVTETAIGAIAVGVHPPEVYLQGCAE
jgi:hypothetical protein